MYKKLLLGIRIVLPFIITWIFFDTVYTFNISSKYALTNSLFLIGFVVLLYGLGAFFFISRNSGVSFSNAIGHTIINMAMAEQNMKNNHQGNNKNTNGISLVKSYLMLIYIVLGISLCIASILVYVL